MPDTLRLDREIGSTPDEPVARWFASRDGEFDMPGCRDHRITFRAAGTASITRIVDGRAVTARCVPGTISVQPSLRETRWQVRGSGDLLQIYVRQSVIDRILAESGDGKDSGAVEIQEVLGGHCAPLHDLCSSLLREAVDGGFATRLYTDTLGLLAAILLLRHCSSLTPAPAPAAGGLPSWRLRRVIEFIDENLDHNVGLEKLAEMAGLSPAHFARMFKQSTGAPPHRFVLERRIAKARALLTATDMRIVDVALSLGFASQEHFSTTFKRLCGATPRAFRNDRRS
jgi:AraC family transcriptional regulator